MNKRILVAFAGALCAFGAVSQSLDEIALDIARRNPGVQAAQARYESELQAAKASNVLAGPEADFDYKFNTRDGEPDRWGFSVGQTFDWPGVYGKRREENRYRAQAYADLYRAALLDMAVDAKQTLISVAVARERMILLDEAVENIKSLAEAYDNAYAQGEATVLDVSKLKLRRFETSNLLAEAEAALEAAEARLRMLGGNVENVPALGVVMANVKLPPLSHYQELLAANDPTVAANRSLVSADAAGASAAGRSLMPSFKLAYTHDYEDRVHFNGFSVGIGLPSWSGKSTRKAAKAAALASRLESEDYSMKVNASLISDYSKAVRLDRRADEARSAFDSDEYPGLLRKALDMRRITLFEYCSEYDSYLAAKTDYLELCGSLAEVVARLGKWEMQ